MGSARTARQGNPVTYRPLPGRVLLVMLAAIGVWWAGDLLVRGRLGQGLIALLWLTAVCTALAALFWRPAVVVDDDGAELRNILRDIRVPWGALEAVETRYALTLVADGRRYTSWASPASGRPGRLSASGPERGAAPGVGAGQGSGVSSGMGSGAGDAVAMGPASRHLRSASGACAFMVEQRWEQWRDTHGHGHAHASGLAARPGGAAPADGDAAGAVLVTWRPHLAGIAVAAAALAVALTPVLG